jgi:hypothetical protein
MNPSKVLAPQVLYTRCDPEQFGFKTAEELAPADFRPLFAPDALRLADAIESEAGGLLVLGRQYKHLAENEIQNRVRLVSNPVLLVR